MRKILSISYHAIRTPGARCGADLAAQAVPEMMHCDSTYIAFDFPRWLMTLGNSPGNVCVNVYTVFIHRFEMVKPN